MFFEYTPQFFWVNFVEKYYYLYCLQKTESKFCEFGNYYFGLQCRESVTVVFLSSASFVNMALILMGSQCSTSSYLYLHKRL